MTATLTRPTSTFRRRKPRPLSVRAIPEQTLNRIAACWAVGLHYHAGHPTPGLVWAVDDEGKFHTVKLHVSRGMAEHYCVRRYNTYDGTRCFGEGAQTGLLIAYSHEHVSGQMSLFTREDWADRDPVVAI